LLAAPISAESDEEVALDSDLRAVALMNLGVVEAWALASEASERHLQQGADLARQIGRPYLEVGCLAQLAFASKIRPFATTRRSAWTRYRSPNATAGTPTLPSRRPW
jgi:LuxR family transcriptional regulator, maltose regulon positive regulatory protein